MAARGTLALGWVLCALLNLETSVSAQGVSLTAEAVTASPGSTVTSRVLMDNTSIDIAGWSFGVCHDQAALSLVSATSGSTPQTAQSGAPVQFESVDLFAEGYTHGVVICFSGCAILGIGTNYELATMTYDVLGADGTSSDLCFCDVLGSPSVDTVFSNPVGSAFVPTQICGTINVSAAPVLLPVSGLVCSPVASPCGANLSWTLNGTYGSLRVLVDGLVAQVLPGTATGASVSLSGLGSHQICVDGTSPTGAAVAATCCTVICEQNFVRGDVNGDSIVDVADAIAQLQIIFGGLVLNDCPRARDANDDGIDNLADAIWLIQYIFAGGMAPPAPVSCGPDPTPDTLTCSVYNACP